MSLLDELLKRLLIDSFNKNRSGDSAYRKNIRMAPVPPGAEVLSQLPDFSNVRSGSSTTGAEPISDEYGVPLPPVMGGQTPMAGKLAPARSSRLTRPSSAPIRNEPTDISFPEIPTASVDSMQGYLPGGMEIEDAPPIPPIQPLPGTMMQQSMLGLPAQSAQTSIPVQHNMLIRLLRGMGGMR